MNKMNFAEKIGFRLILLLMACSCIEKNQEVDAVLNVNKNQIQYKTGGNGQELLMVHGGYLDLSMWQPQFEEFKKYNKIILFSDLGHGKTIASDQPIFGHEIINKLSQASEENTAVLVGLSWGAMLCVEYALNHPEKVKKLVLVSPGLNGWNYFQDTIAAKNYSLRKAATEKNDIETAAKLFHATWVLGPRRNPKDLDKVFFQKSLEMITSNMTKHWKEDWSRLDSIPATERLTQIKVPTYIIIGEHDAEDIKLIADVYDNKIPNSQVIILKNAAHLLTMEQPNEFNRVLRKILRE